MSDAIIPDNPAMPAGATGVSGWVKTWRGRIARQFDGTTRVVDVPDDWGCIGRPVSVVIDGLQYNDGRARRVVHLLSSGEPLAGPFTPHDARQLGAALIAAADECDECASRDGVTE